MKTHTTHPDYIRESDVNQAVGDVALTVLLIVGIVALCRALSR